MGTTDADSVPGGNEKVLVVDDDDMQREVSKLLLTKLGYEVATTSSGESAIEILQTSQVDLLILDMIMTPSIDGTETYRRALQINPHQKAIIVSGFSGSERVIEAQRLGVGAFVRKPLTRKSLGVAVRTELDKKAVTTLCQNV
jgi:two-component system cell cycle sensor histidine kinase/response regulator CckA